MAKNGYDQTYENDRLQNEEDKGLPKRAAKAVVKSARSTMDVIGPDLQRAFDDYAAKEEAKSKAAKESREAGGREAVKGMKEGRMDATGMPYKKGGSVSSASARADGCCIRGKTKA